MKAAGFPQKTPFFVFAVLLLVHLLYFLSSQLNQPATLSDSHEYVLASENLYRQGVLYCGDLSEPIVEEKFTRRPPLYPLLLGTATFSGSRIPAILLQILISMVSISLVFKIFRLNPGAFNSGKQAAVFAMVLLLATPAQFIYANLIMAEILFQFLLVGMAWSVYRYLASSESHYVWLFHLFLTLGMATKPVLFPFAIVCLILALALCIRTRKTVFLLALILPVGWMGFYSIWNYNRTGTPQYSSIQTANLVNYNLRYFLMGQEGSEFAAAEVDRLYDICGQEAAYPEKNKCLEKGVRQVLLDRPLNYAVFHLKGSLRYFLDPGRFDLVTFFTLEESGSPGILQVLNQEGIGGVCKFLKQEGWVLLAVLLLIGLFKLVKITGFILYLFMQKEQLAFRIFLALLVGYLALVTGPLGASRFLLPVELFLIGGALLGWRSLFTRKSLTQNA